MLVSIIIPVYNERAHIKQVLEEVSNVNLPLGLKREIIIVDDGSNDGTIDFLRTLTESEYSIHYCEENIGKSSALRIGFRMAQGNIIIIQDADLECRAYEYPKLLAPILNGETNIVFGSRFKGIPQGMKVHYRIANAILTGLVWLCYHKWLTDVGTVYKVFKRDLLDDIELESKRFEFATEFTSVMLSRGEKIIEVPIDYVARTIEEGKKIRFKDAFIIYYTLIKQRLKLGLPKDA